MAKVLKTQRSVNQGSKSPQIQMESQAMLLNTNDSQFYLPNDSSMSIEKKDGSTENREKWDNKIDFFFSCLGYSVGLGNVWRFPYLCYKNGGGAFLIAYGTGILFGGIPMFLLETCVGQYTSQGGPNTWNISPVFKGVGYASAIMCFQCNMYFIVLVAWSLYYLVASFTKNLPWATCGNSWNSEHCVTPFDHSSDKFFNHSAAAIATMKSSADEYWLKNVLKQSAGMEQFGGVRWELAICLFVAWLMIYFCLFKGIKWTGKVVYFTSTVPFVCLAIILVRGLTLEGAWNGVKFLFIPDWNRLYSAEMWVEALAQGFYSYGVGFGGVTTLGSYNVKEYNNLNVIVICSIISEITCLVAGLCIFSVLGYMAHVTGQTIDHVADGGPGLAFVAYPNALTQLPISPLWSVMFFVMLIFVALDGQFVCVEGFIAACTDVFPKLRNRRMSFLAAYAMFSFALGFVFVTEAGIYWFEIFNTFSCTGWAMLTIISFQCIAVSYGYGIDRFYDNVQEMLGFYPNRYWKYCWSVLTPGMCIIVIIFSLLKSEPFKYKDYVYPWYGVYFGYFLTFSSLVCIPIYALYMILTNLDNLKSIIRPETQKTKKKEIYKISDEDLSV